jgi:hypothetical protein
VDEAPEIFHGFVSEIFNAPAIVTDAAQVRALHMVYSVAEAARAGESFTVDYAIWKVWTQPGGSPKTFVGYLVITLVADGTVASIDSSRTFGDDVIDKAIFAAKIQDFLASDDAPSYDDSADIGTDIGNAGGKVRFETEE